MVVRRWAALALSVVIAGAAAPAAAEPVDPGSAPRGTVLVWGDRGAIVQPPAGLTDAVHVSSAYDYTLALRSNGTVVGWGSDREATPPAGLTDVREVSAAMWRAAALRADGTVQTWGTTRGDDAALGSGNLAVAAGTNFTAVLRPDRTVRVEGAIFGGSLIPPAGLKNVRAIAAGSYRGVSASPCGYLLALRTDGTVVGWGGSSNYGAGCGQEADKAAQPPAGLDGVISLAAGSSFALALRTDGTVVAWGNSTSPGLEVPAGLHDVVAVSAGAGSAAALLADGTVVRWGSGADSPGPADPGQVAALATSTYDHLVGLRVASRLGSPVLQTRTDENTNGTAEAFRVTAASAGSVSTLSVYLDPTSKADRVQLGVYAATADGEPGALLGQGSATTTAVAGRWVDVTVPTVTLTAGRTYWLALLGPKGSGKLRFRDRPDGTGGPTRTSAQTGLTELPATWRTGQSFVNGPVSLYAR